MNSKAISVVGFIRANKAVKPVNVLKSVKHMKNVFAF